MGYFFDRKFFKREFLPNLANWILAALMFVTSKIFDRLFSPFERRFSLKDTSISYPHQKTETVNNIWLWLSSLLFPAIIITFLNLIKQNFREMHRNLLGLFFSTALAYLITHITKNLVGRLRPDFLDRCDPKEDSFLGEKFYFLATGDVCNISENNVSLIRGGRQSFFSGHTSTAFSGLGYLSLYLTVFFTLWKRPGSVYKTWAALIPLLVALCIALSRISDYRHHWEDVLVGMIVGYGCAYFCFKQAFLLDYKETPNINSAESLDICAHESIPLTPEH